MSKKVKLTEEDKVIQENLEKLASIQEEVTKLNLEEEKEIAKIQAKFDDLKKPVFAKRKEFISKIDEFWANTFANHDFLSNFISDSDIEVLKHLEDIEVESSLSDDIKKVKVIFKFKPNPFFKNTELWKYAEVNAVKDKEGSSNKDVKEEKQVALTINQSGIDWKEGKNYITKGSHSGVSGKDTNNKKKRDMEESLDEDESFLRMFVEETSMDEDYLLIISDEIYENPVAFFLGQGDQGGLGESFIEEDLDE
ncbi:hypothetical protein ABK040_009688 [Willaertia magna]